MLYFITRMRLVCIGLPPPSFFNDSLRCVPAASVISPPIRIECRENSSGLRPNFATNSSIARRVRPYLTTLTDLLLRYEGREAWSGRLETHDINSNIKAMSPPYTLKDDFEPRTSVRVRTRTLPTRS